MISAVDMKAVKRRVSSAYFADGLWDILLGIFLITIMYPSLTLSLVSVFSYCIGYCIVERVRRAVTYPRMGYVKTAGKWRLEIMPLLGIAIFLLFVVFRFLQNDIIIWEIITSSTSWHRESREVFAYIQMLQYAPIPAVVAFVAYRFKVKRWYLYAALSVLSLVLGAWFWADHIYTYRMPNVIFNVPASVTLINAVPGTVMLITGIIVFARFLRNNPKIVEGESPQESEV